MRARRAVQFGTVCAALLFAGYPLRAGVVYPGPAPGPAIAEATGGELVLHNAVISCRWSVSKGVLRLVDAGEPDAAPAARVLGGEPAVFVRTDGRSVSLSEMHVTTRPAVEELSGDPGSPRLAERMPGVALSAGFEDPRGVFRVAWRAELRDGSNAVRQSFLIDAGVTGAGAGIGASKVSFREIRLLDLTMPGASLAGTVAGSPVVAGRVFAAIEHPLAEHRIEGDRVIGRLVGVRGVEPGSSLELSSVIGVVPEGQLRRGFLYYLERERAHPYRVFLHYNSWYDLGIGRTDKERMTQAECLERIETMDEELRRKRGVAIDAYLWDDGWDDLDVLWQFSKGFPHGFRPLVEAARPTGAAMGVWLSPWGGYGEAKQRRLERARDQGFETDRNGLSLAGRHTYQRFRDTCLEMLAEQDVRIFKFDGVGEANMAAGAAGEAAADVDALIRLSRELRFERPDLFINVTVGSWPSPYWLWCADSIWRGGEDVSFDGQGNKRRRWITYRDGQVYRNIVRRAPLFPLDSVMIHGLVIADRGVPAGMGRRGADLADEIHTVFGSGTGLQELYITPTLMSAEVWDELARTAAWARGNAEVLVDSHWVGGDPSEGEVYGFASWASHKGILVLRNPVSSTQEFDLCLEDLFELPAQAPQRYRLSLPFDERDDLADTTREAAEHRRLKLKRFEVLIIEAIPDED